MIVRIPVRAVSESKRERQTDFVIIGENQTNTDFSLEDAGKTLAYMLSKHLYNGVYLELYKALGQLFEANSHEEHQKLMKQFEICARKFEVK